MVCSPLRPFTNDDAGKVFYQAFGKLNRLSKDQETTYVFHAFGDHRADTAPV
jgi:hypothetical protein